MRIQIGTPLKAEAASVRVTNDPKVVDNKSPNGSVRQKAETQARQLENATILFGASGKNTLEALRKFDALPEVTLKPVHQLLTVLYKSTPQQLREYAASKSAVKYTAAVSDLLGTDSLGALLSKSRALKLPKPLQRLHDAKPQWGLETGPKYSPNVSPDLVHGNELIKMRYSGESHTQFEQHLVDSLLRGQKNGVLELVKENTFTSVAKKKIGSKRYSVRRRDGKGPTLLVGEWAKGGKGWHYDKLPKVLRNALP